MVQVLRMQFGARSTIMARQRGARPGTEKSQLWGTCTMHDFFIAPRADVWEVRLGKYLVSAQSTQLDAIQIAQAIARDVATRGSPSRVLVGDWNGEFREISVDLQ